MITSGQVKPSDTSLTKATTGAAVQLSASSVTTVMSAAGTSPMHWTLTAVGLEAVGLVSSSTVIVCVTVIELLQSSVTLLSVVESLLLGGVLGIALGLYLGGSRWRLPGLYATLAAMKPVPVTVLIPVFLAVFGLDGFIVPIVALPILTNVSVNVAQAIRTCSVRRRALLRGWGIDGPAYIRHVLVYESLDCLLATACILVPFCLALNIALDYFLRVTDGLGSYVATGYEQYRFDQMFAGIATVAAIGLLSSFALDVLSARSLQWKRET